MFTGTMDRACTQQASTRAVRQRTRPHSVVQLRPAISPVLHRSCHCSPELSRSSGRCRSRLVCHALEGYMVDKLAAAEGTFKELQLRMADPDVANNATEFQKVCAPTAHCTPLGVRKATICLNSFGLLACWPATQQSIIICC